VAHVLLNWVVYTTTLGYRSLSHTAQNVVIEKLATKVVTTEGAGGKSEQAGK